MQYAKNDAKEWKQVEDSEMYESDRRHDTNVPQRQGHRKRPPNGWIKCNTDGSFINGNSLTTAGWVIRDSDGMYSGAVKSLGQRVQRPLESELQAILMAIQHCWSLGYGKIVMETDCKTAKEILHDNKLQFHVYNWTRDIKWWCDKFEDICFQ